MIFGHWLREALGMNKMKSVHDMSRNQPNPKARCLVGLTGPIISEPKLYIFMSLVVPEVLWLSLSQEMQGEGVFVIRSLPQNSFRELSKRLTRLKERGVMAQIEIDPGRFEHYEVTTVPTFVVGSEEEYDKVMGEVSLRSALEQMAHTGKTAEAKALYLRLKEKSP